MRLNKLACILFALLLVVLLGCSGKDTDVKQADFSFNLPEGYSLSDVTDESCNIVSDEDNAIIGGITVTNLKPKLLSNENSTTEIMTYLQNEFHKTNNVEFIALYGGKEKPSVTINLTKIADDTGEKSHFQHIFFEKGGIVYHLWLDMDVVDPEAADEIAAFVRGEKAQLTASDTAAEPQQHLRLSVSFDDDADYVEYTSDELGGNFSEKLIYNFNITSVTIDIDGQSMPLNEALRDGFITEEEIFCDARLDAREGFCEETYESLNGLTNFTFAYPDYNIRLLYDIYESPSGEQRLISEMVVYEKDTGLAPCHLFVDDETGEIYDLEDWGLSFEITEVSPTGMTIRCTHSGGQQIGQLEATGYYLSSNGLFLLLNDGSESSPPMDNVVFKDDDVTEFTLDWAEPYGQLSSGEYRIMLYVHDVYDESQKHPLMRNFYDTQIYNLDFTIS